MSFKYDSESVLEMIKGVMLDGADQFLNDKIAEVEAEKTAQSKGLTPTLAPISDTAYYEQTWTDKILQTTPGIFYGIEDQQTVSGGGNVNAKTYKCFIEIILCDNGQTNDYAKRILRYTRALEELFAAAFDKAAQFGQVKIETMRPMAFKLELDSDNEIKVGGISVSITLV